MALREHLEFERPIAEIEEKIERLRSRTHEAGPQQQEEVRRLERKVRQLIEEIYARLTPWQRTMVARHPARPTTLDYIGAMIKNFLELHGDRLYADDPALIGGIGTFHGRPVVVLGHQKGRGTKDRAYRNFGMPHPEGYRKALRLMRLAERFKAPVLTFIDTPGAYPGIGAEERGQAEAIATNLLVMSELKVPIIATVIGEGGSGGALALSVADRILMLEYAVYSVISPEGCAAILWRDGGKAEEAAERMKLTASDLTAFGIIDEIVAEPTGGAHRGPPAMVQTLDGVLQAHLTRLDGTPADRLVQERYEKFRRMGVFKS